MQRASNCFSCVFDAVSQTFVLGRFQMTLSCKAFVNACYCRVHKYILRNVFTDFTHNDVEIWRFLLWDKYIFPWQVTASAVCSALLHQHSHLPDFNPPDMGKAFVNANQCRVHKYILRNVFTDLEHNDVEIWRFFLEDKYIFSPASNWFSSVFSAASQKFALGSLQMAH